MQLALGSAAGELIQGSARSYWKAGLTLPNSAALKGKAGEP